jgi:nucleoside-diphosphate-sugar epimerase
LKNRLLVTGARGFTGKHLVYFADEEGFEILSSQVDILDYEDLRREVLKLNPDFVIHLAAISSSISKNQKLVFETNLIGSLNLLMALNDLPKKPKKILMVSSAQVYGDTTDEFFSETDQVNPLNHYGASKLSMEIMTKQFYKDLPIIIARPFNYTGIGHDLNFVIPKIISCFKQRKPIIELGNLDTEREYNDVRSVCKAYLKLLISSEESEIFNVCSGEVYSIRTIISKLESMSNHQIKVIQNPDFIRPNELKKLCGNPQKLNRIVGDLSRYTLSDTLEWMLKN